MSLALRALFIGYLGPQLALWAIDIPPASRAETLQSLISWAHARPGFTLAPAPQALTLPRAPDSKRHPRNLNIDEQSLEVRTHSHSGKLADVMTWDDIFCERTESPFLIHYP